MKQRGKRSNSKLVHVSFDEVERFVPRVPKQICPDEDNTTPRICVAPNILSAIQAMPQGGTVAYNMARIGVPVVIHANFFCLFTPIPPLIPHGMISIVHRPYLT